MIQFSKSNKETGFTLIEVLVVVGIIGLLTSIVLVSIKGVREKARVTAGLNFAAQVHHALGAYAVGIWDFDENVDNTCRPEEPYNDICDSSGNNNHGERSGPTWVDDTPNKSGYALSFSESGDGDEVYVSNVSINPSTEITAMAWIKPNEAADSRAPIIKMDRFYLQHYEDNKLATYWFGWDSEGYHYSTSDSVLTGKWSHVVVTWDQTNGVTFYINGTKDNNIPNSGTGESTNWVMIGREGPTRRFNGLIDEVRVYDHALTSAQVRKLYVEGLKRHLTMNNEQ